MWTGRAAKVAVTALAVLAVAALLVPESKTVAVQGYVPRTAEVPALSMMDLRPHLLEFERIANENYGNRSHGTKGYAQSLDYVEGKLKAAGFVTSRQEFRFDRDITANLIADWPGGDPSKVLMTGAHLDSVLTGPGINDNATGSAAVLAMALSIAKARHQPPVHLRFAFWGAEELGLRGSDFYVRSLSPEAKAAITGYINVDMIGGPNGGYFLYDGDDSKHEGAGPGPQGSAQIEKALADYFASVKVTPYEVDFEMRSDYASFLRGGIPAGGLLTGTREIMPAALAELWGGTAGVPFDHCYHQACDTNANINERVYLNHANAAMYAALALSGAPQP